MRINDITGRVIGAAIEVHRELGPGLLESSYEASLEYELVHDGLCVQRQEPVPVVYKGIRLECGYRMDLLVERQVVVEIKAVDLINNIHKAQLLSYLKLSGLTVGLLINFNVEVLRSGVQRIVNRYQEKALP